MPIRRNVSARRALQGGRGKPELADNAANGFAHCELGLSEPIGKSTPQRRATYAETPSKRRAGKNSSRPKARRIPAGLPAGAPRRTRAKNLPTKSREWRFRRPSPPDIKTEAGWRVDYPEGRVFFPNPFRRRGDLHRRDGGTGVQVRGEESKIYYPPQRFRRLRNPLYLFRKLRGNFILQTSGFSRRTVPVGNRQD